MQPVKLYRKRYIPAETVYLKDDEILFCDEEKIITKWKVIRKRPDFSHGVSCVFLKEGFKISKFIDEKENVIFWYCDIINYDFDENTNSYYINDLLIDIIIQNNGNVKVLDLDEIAEALESRIISEEIVCEAMRKANKLLNIIYSGHFSDYTKYIYDI